MFRPVFIFIAGTSTMTLAACASVSYDQTTDQQVTAIVQEGNQQFTSLESKLSARTATPYDTTFYDKVESDLKTLKLRIQSSPDTITQSFASNVDGVVLLFENMRSIQRSKSGFADIYYVKAQEMLFDEQMANFTRYELVLKGGGTAASASSEAAAPPATGQAPKPAATP